MQQLFSEILKMSITASYCVFAVLLLRLILKRFPKIYSYVLWAVVFFRMVFPFSIKSAFSMLKPGTKLMHAINPELNSAFDTPGSVTFNVAESTANVTASTANTAVNASNAAADAHTVSAASNLTQNIFMTACVIWITVVAGIAVYSVVSAFRLRKKLRNSVHFEANIYESDNISTPFVFGIIKPRIYLPANLSEAERGFVLKHELTHIRRRDYIIKPLAFFIVCLHWFNPFAWMAFYLMSKDMEMSCDESVIGKLSRQETADYSQTLLAIAAGKRFLGASPLAFSEGNVKDRIKNVLKFKKPVAWVTGLIVAVLVAVIAGLSLNPKDSSVTEELLSNTEINNESDSETTYEPEENFPEAAIIEYYNVLKNKKASQYIVYLKVLEMVEIDYNYAKENLLESNNYDNEEAKAYAVCVDYTTNGRSNDYENGKCYDFISLKKNNAGWKVDKHEKISKDNIRHLVEMGYALSEEYVAAVENKVEKTTEVEVDWDSVYKRLAKLEKEYRAGIVKEYNKEPILVSGYKLEPVDDRDFDLNNLIKLSYYEQSDVSLYCYEVTKMYDGFEYQTYKLLLEHNGVYQVFDTDGNIYFGNLFGYNYGEAYLRDFDKGIESDYDGDGELELAECILQGYGSSGYTDYVIAVLDYNNGTGLYDFYYKDNSYYHDLRKDAVEEFIHENYGEYTTDEHGRYLLEDGFAIIIGNDNNVSYNLDDSFKVDTFIWGGLSLKNINDTDQVEPGNDIASICLKVRYIGDGNFSVEVEEYQQLQY